VEAPLDEVPGVMGRDDDGQRQHYREPRKPASMVRKTMERSVRTEWWRT
jgi:hypothetical protein